MFTLPMLALFSVGAIAAESTDYSRCIPAQGTLNQAPYQLGKDGTFDFNPQDKSVVLFKNEKEEQRLAYSSPWLGKDKNGDAYLVTVVLDRAGGKTNSVQVKYDQRWISEKSPWYLPKRKEVFASSKVTFGFNENRCFVQEISDTSSRGKEVVNYNRDLCKKVFGLVKKSTLSKLLECKESFAEIRQVINSLAADLKKQKKELSLGYENTAVNISRLKDDQNGSVMNVLHACYNAVSMYGDSYEEPGMAAPPAPTPNEEGAN